MAIEIDSIVLQVRTDGLAQAIKEQNDLAASSENAEQKFISQKRAMELYNTGVKEYSQQQAEAIRMNKEFDKSIATQAMIEQKRQMELFVAKGKEYAAAQAEAIRMNKEFDNAAKQVEQAQQKVARANQDVANRLELLRVSLNGTKGDYEALKAKIAGASEEMQAQAKITGDTLQHEIEKGTGAMGRLGLGTVGAKRELLVLAHEASQGQWQRFGGSLLVLGERMEGLGALVRLLLHPYVILTAAVVGFGIATYHSAKEVEEFKKSLILTNNTSGMTRDNLEAMTNSLATLDVGVGKTKDMLKGLAATGLYTSETIMTIGKSAVSMANVTGDSAEEVLKFYEGLGDGALAWAEKHNKSMGAMDDKLYAHIRALEESGQSQEAMRVAVEAFNVTTESHVEKMGIVTGTWWGFKEMILAAGRAIDGIGKPLTKLEEVMKAEGKVKDINDNLQFAIASKLDKETINERKQQLKEALAELQKLNAGYQADEIKARKDAEKAEVNREAAAAEKRLQDLRKSVRSKEQIVEEEIAQVEKDWSAKIKAAQLRGDELAGVEEKILKDIEAVREKHKERDKKPRDTTEPELAAKLEAQQAIIRAEKDASEAALKYQDELFRAGKIIEQDKIENQRSILQQEVKNIAVAYEAEFALLEKYQGRDEAARLEHEKKKAKLKEDANKSMTVVLDKLNSLSIEQESIDAKSYDTALKQVEALEKQAAALENNYKVRGKSKSAIDAEELALAQQGLTMLENLEILARQNKATDEEMERIRKIIELKKRERDARQGIFDAQAQEEINIAAEKTAAEYARAFKNSEKKIEDGLYSALTKGGNNAIKKLVSDMKEWFARLVLSPIIQPIAQYGASILNPSSAASQGVTLASTASNIYGAIAGAGSIFGSTGFMASLAGGLNGAGVGSGLTSSLGLEIGNTISGVVGTQVAGTLSSVVSALSTVAPYLTAAAVLYKGLSMGDKQMTGQTVTGTFGANGLDAFRNVSWTQKGGFLRSDRSGTWSYNLSNSTAIQDGKTYQDSASVSSDQAMLSQLNAMYTAVKQANTDYAKSLGLDANLIKEHSDSLNFAFGKTAEETAININKAFSDISDKIAKDVLGSLNVLANVGESSTETLKRLSTDIATVNGAMTVLGYNLFSLNVEGVKASEALLALFGGIDKFNAITVDYYNNYYNQAEKTQLQTEQLTKSFSDLGKNLPKTRDELRAMIEEAYKAGDTELYANLMKLTKSFADLVPASEQAANSVDSAKNAMSGLASTAEKWLNIRTSAASLQDSISQTLGNPTKDPTVRISQLWKALSSDISPEQKMTLAGELKDLIISKYNVEKQAMQSLIDFGKQLRNYVESLKTGTLSPLTMTEKLLEAKRQYEATLAAAQTGDASAQSKLQGSADTYLQLAQTAFASSDQYREVFSQVTTSLDSLSGQSMSVGERANSIAASELEQLNKLKDFASSMEKLSDYYYKQNIDLLAKQVDVLKDMYNKMGIFDGISAELAALPADIAAALAGKLNNTSNVDFVTSLYKTYAGKSGSQIDSAGMSYWVDEVTKFGKDYVLKAFQDSVKSITGGATSAPPPTASNLTTTVLASKLDALTTEVQGLRQDSAQQTGAVITATVMSNQENAQTIVGATINNQSSSWNETNKVSII